MLRRTLIGLLTCLSLCLAAVSPTLAETRAALVIGNSAYTHAPALANPAHDAASVAQALRQVGFTVTSRSNLDKSQLEAALKAFARDAANADVAVVYFAGHGMVVGGVNYLVPVDAVLASDRDADYEAVPLALVQRSVEDARRLKLVILDACRNNPFLASMQRTGGTRAVGRGLIRVEPEGDMLVAYAAKEGSVADDGDGSNSPFAAALVRRIATPGLEIRLLFGQVRDDVLQATGRRQEPAIYGSLGGQGFYFVPPPTGSIQATVTAVTPTTVDPRAVELAFWQAVAESNDPAQLNAYLRRYPNGDFAPVAQAKLARLSSGASQPPPPQAAARPPAADRPASGLAAPTTLAARPTDVQRSRGLADAPGLISAGRIDCQVSDARLIGETRQPAQAFYELACQNNEGVVAMRTPDGRVQVFTCVETAAPQPDGRPSSLSCGLAGNLDAAAGLGRYVTKAGGSCLIDRARGVGHTETKGYFELVCRNGDSFILTTTTPPRMDGEVSLTPCAAFETGAVSCTLTARSAQLAVADRLAAQSGKGCTVRDRAFVMVSTANDAYYEVACQGGKGYILKADRSGALARTIDCVNADFVAGGCKLTDTRTARTEQVSLYTRLARGGGFECDVKSYAPFAVGTPGKEVVELACNGRTDGVVAVFSAQGGASEFYDCAHAELKGYRCSLTPTASTFPQLTTELRNLGTASCTVSGSRIVGVTQDNRGFIEVACAEGQRGYIVEYGLTPLAPRSAFGCVQAAGIGGGCRLAGNVRPGA